MAPKQFAIGMVLLTLLVSGLFLAACGGTEADPAATSDPTIVAGKRLFQRHCASCHALEPEAVVVGPSLAGIAARAGNRMPNYDARQYIELSILHPNAYLVAGFDDLMPSTLGKELTGEELDTLVGYLLTLN